MDPTGGKIELRASNADDYVLIEVVNYNSEISQYNLARIFDPFFTTYQEGKGDGIGLAVAKAFVKQNKGHIEMFQKDDKTITANIYFPRVINPKESQKIVYKRIIPENLRGEGNVIVLDPSNDYADLYANMLKRCGYSVVVCEGEDVFEGLNKLFGDDVNNRCKPDLALLNAIFQGSDLESQLIELYPRIKIIYITNGTSYNKVNRELSAVITKPFKVEELAKVVKDVLFNF
jgi:hypothetical protein